MKLFTVMSMAPAVKDCPKTIPWDCLNEEWAQILHCQDLEMLNRRGGLDPTEIYYVVNKKKWPIKREEWVSIDEAVEFVKNLQPK